MSLLMGAKRNWEDLTVAHNCILLVTVGPELLYGAVLRSAGYQVDTTRTFEEARPLWQPQRYALILIMIDGDPSKPLGFCQEIKQSYPSQLIAFGTNQGLYFGSCPDDVINRADGPAVLVKRIYKLIGPPCNPNSRGVPQFQHATG